MPTLELEFEVYCGCGEGLCLQASKGRTPGRGMSYITVEPCEKCLDRAHDKGYDEGYNEGYKKGMTEE